VICLLQLRETRNILEEVSPEVVAGLRGALRRAGQVCCYGPGREGLVLKAFATRLHQLGIKVIDYPSRTVLSLLHASCHASHKHSRQPPDNFYRLCCRLTEKTLDKVVQQCGTALMHGCHAGQYSWGQLFWCSGWWGFGADQCWPQLLRQCQHGRFRSKKSR